MPGRNARSLLHTFTTLQPHFLKSVCSEIGSVASSVTLLMSWLASNHGTNTTPRGGLVAAARLDAGAHAAAARRDLDLVAAPHAERLRVLGMQVDDGVREREVQLRHAARHRARMPVLEHAAGDQPQRIFLVRRLRRRLVGQREDVGLVVRVAVELEAGAGLHVGILALAEAPARLLAVHHRPAQPAHLVIGVEGREVVAVAAAEARVLLEQPLCT